MKPNLINKSVIALNRLLIRKKIICLIINCILLQNCGQAIKKTEIESPIQEYGVLLKDIIDKRIFSDPKIFLDAEPKIDIKEIVDIYQNSKDLKDFDLKKFITIYFKFDDYKRNKDNQNPYSEFLVKENKKGSLIPQKTPRLSSSKNNLEFHYEDLYLSILALKKLNNDSLAKNLIINSAQFIQDFGYIPFGDRAYYFGRSSLPFFAISVMELAKSDSTLLERFLPQIQKEYNFWMSTKNNIPTHYITVDKNLGLNRFYSDLPLPRAENYYQDLEYAKNDSMKFFQLNAFSESNYFSRERFQLKNELDVLNFLAFDLNVLLYQYELILEKGYTQKQQNNYAENINYLGKQRLNSIQTLCWDKSKLVFNDYSIGENAISKNANFSYFFALFFKMVDKKRAEAILLNWRKTKDHKKVVEQFSPLHFYIVYKGLSNYGFIEDANELKKMMNLIKNDNSLAFFNLSILLS